MRNFQQICKDESHNQISTNVEEPKRSTANTQDNLYQQSLSDSLTSNQNVIMALQKAYGNRIIQRMYSDSQVSNEETSWNYLSLDDFQANIPENSEEQLAQRVEKAIGTGNQLDSDILGDLESGLGVNLTHLRIHQDAEADSLAHSFKAAAFTTGSDIFFRHGTFNPRTEIGFRLLAHETAHVVQQRDSSLTISENSAPLTVSEPTDQFEQEADAAAEKIVAGQTTDIQPRQTSTVSLFSFDDVTDFLSPAVKTGLGVLNMGRGIIAEGANLASQPVTGSEAFTWASEGAKSLGAGKLGGISQGASKLFGPLGILSGAAGMYSASSDYLEQGQNETYEGAGHLANLSASTVGTIGGVLTTIGAFGSSAAAASAGAGGAILGAGAAGFGVGNLIAENIIDPILNRTKSENSADHGTSFVPGKAYDPAEDNMPWYLF